LKKGMKSGKDFLTQVARTQDNPGTTL